MDANSEYIEITGLSENAHMLGKLLTSDTTLGRNLRKLIRDVLKTARKDTSRDIGGYIKDDPRKAARAVKTSVYKQLFGGNLSILQKRKAGARYQYNRPRKLDTSPNQRGGNRRQRSDRTKQLDSYFGADRGFILRFLNAGTAPRTTRYGNRGQIGQTDLFGHSAPWHMQHAAETLADAISEYITQTSNNG